ncbi:adenine deaminase C-terminal domain-containing protein [Virgibacillus dokdonensis]|uniref:adenine deaminase n=1 Tax=Virgibacillus dokdonensis TaxID=302167 RepID=A0A2K9IWK9_9BACI|nr:adenine deaminase C-terminal domain-containing protein [Virgibacillus dokdonensis]AUJ24132.1 Putative adenine deaminase YerA [Virgibacillus dokdonensis]
MENIRAITSQENKSLINTALRREAPSIFFKHVNILNVYTGVIEKTNIFISGKRIAYVGDNNPICLDSTEIVELNNNEILVPGYIEPHAHPNQMYNPFTHGNFLTSKGTTVSINDNLSLFINLKDDEAIEFVNLLDQTGIHLWLWWAYFDSPHKGVSDQEYRFDIDYLRKWGKNPFVVQGGEFTSWPKLMNGDEKISNMLLFFRQKLGKRIEGHLPGASSDTLNVLAAAGITADHESLNGKDVINRLKLGYYAALRYSSIRRDLPNIIQELVEYPNIYFSRLMLTNDGSALNFLEYSTHSQMIKMVIKLGMKPIDAFRMATINPATYYRIDNMVGGIAPGRLAHINIIEDLYNPEPISVMVDGEWAYRNKNRCKPLNSKWINKFLKNPNKYIQIDSIEPTTSIGIKLLNDVITKSYQFNPNDDLSEDECYLTYINQEDGSFLNTRIKGFSNSLIALASTYSASQDYILIGKNKVKMLEVIDEVLKEGGGIISLFDNNEKIKISLPLSGIMSTEPIESLKNIVEKFNEAMKNSGFLFDDPTYTLLFLTATHLPSIRLTKKGLYSIKDKKIFVHNIKI